VGGSVIVQSFLRAADDAIDRKRATSRDEEVKIMETVSFEKAVAVLPAYCLELMQNLTPADQAGFADRVARISKIKADNPAKSRLLGLAIMNVMGPDVLKAAMKSLGKDIQA
jgi:hypothetical protein